MSRAEFEGARATAEAALQPPKPPPTPAERWGLPDGPWHVPAEGEGGAAFQERCRQTLRKLMEMPWDGPAQGEDWKAFVDRVALGLEMVGAMPYTLPGDYEFEDFDYEFEEKRGNFEEELMVISVDVHDKPHRRRPRGLKIPRASPRPSPWPAGCSTCRRMRGARRWST